MRRSSANSAILVPLVLGIPTTATVGLAPCLRLCPPSTELTLPASRSRYDHDRLHPKPGDRATLRPPRGMVLQYGWACSQQVYSPACLRLSTTTAVHGSPRGCLETFATYIPQHGRPARRTLDVGDVELMPACSPALCCGHGDSTEASRFTSD